MYEGTVVHFWTHEEVLYNETFLSVCLVLLWLGDNEIDFLADMSSSYTTSLVPNLNAKIFVSSVIS